MPRSIRGYGCGRGWGGWTGRHTHVVGADRRVRPGPNATMLPSRQGGHGGPPLRHVRLAPRQDNISPVDDALVVTRPVQQSTEGKYAEAWHAFVASRYGVVGLVLLAIVALAAIFAPL